MADERPSARSASISTGSGSHRAHPSPESQSRSAQHDGASMAEPMSGAGPRSVSRQDDTTLPAYQGSYGSMASYSTAPSEQAGSDSREEGISGLERSQESRLSSRASSMLRQRKPGNQGPSETKPPAGPRRASSYAQTPRRRQEFSTYDDLAEIEAKLARRTKNAPSGATGRGTLRRQPSTLRRRGTVQPTTLSPVESTREGDNGSQDSGKRVIEDVHEEEEEGEQEDGEETLDDSGGDGTIRPEDGRDDSQGGAEEEDDEEEEEEEEDDDDDDDGSVSDAESFTLKDRQQAINKTHPFGIRVWKPALYKKNRSVQKFAEGDIHSSPGGQVNNWVFVLNLMWTIFFGWWLACAAAIGGTACVLTGWVAGGMEYGMILLGLASYLLYPFGKFVRLHQDEEYAEEDEGEGRSITEYEQWQSGDLEDGRMFFGESGNRSVVGRRRSSVDSATEGDSLLGRTWGRSGDGQNGARTKRRLFGRGEWNLGRVIFFICFYGLMAPLLLLTSLVCWLLVFWIPMGKIAIVLYSHLRRHPLALSFHPADGGSRGTGSPSSSILVCTYRAAGLKYWKYTIDGTNIFLINLMSVVVFVIFDYYVLKVALQMSNFATHPALIFLLSLVSVIPLAYFIGQAVASISAQSSMGVGAAINAFFSTVVEVYLYCVALAEGKGQLVEGSVIGSIFAGILFLPGISMCFGALRRKTQRFNAKSAGVTSTMLLFAVIAAFSPTLFYQIYGTHELNCQSCVDTDERTSSRDCRRCYFSQVPAINDRFYHDAVRPYCFMAAALLFLSYVIGLWFTLRTHAAVIWNTEVDEKKATHHDLAGGGGGGTEHDDARGSITFGPTSGGTRHQAGATESDLASRSSVRDSQLYKRILGQSMNQAGLSPGRRGVTRANTMGAMTTTSPHMVPPRDGGGGGASVVSSPFVQIPGLSEQENRNLAREVVEVAATAATVAAREAAATPARSGAGSHPSPHVPRSGHSRAGPVLDDDAATIEAISSGVGHDAPNWGRMKSAVILLGATVLYAIIAEILVNTVDIVLDNVDVEEKFVGITLFALVPNTTEFLNAISFAMNGNIALSMEIGSAYALQVCLLQIPALVLYSAVRAHFMSSATDTMSHTFTLIFPQWDMVTLTLCVFLLSYMYGEGKSNYFKGSILLLSYLVVIVGFYLSGKTAMSNFGNSRFDPIISPAFPPIGSTSSSSGGAGTVPLAANKETFRTIGRGRSGRAW